MQYDIHFVGTYEDIQDADIITNETDLRSERFVNAVRYTVSLPHNKMKEDVIYELEVVASNDNGETTESFNLTKVSSPTCGKIIFSLTMFQMRTNHCNNRTICLRVFVIYKICFFWPLICIPGKNKYSLWFLLMLMLMMLMLISWWLL